MVYLLPPFLLLPAEICHTFPGHVPPLLTAPCLPLDFLHSYQQHSTTRCLQWRREYDSLYHGLRESQVKRSDCI